MSSANTSVRRRISGFQPSLEILEAREVPAALGALDPSFGAGGSVLLASAVYNDVAVQADGKIVAVGQLNNNFLISRYNPDGTFDSTFATAGKQTVNFGVGGAIGDVADAHAVAIQTDGKIVVVGNATDAANSLDYAVARLNTDGSLDASFGASGKQTVNFLPTHRSFARAVAIQADGNIVVVGAAADATDNNVDFAVARLTTTGSLDAGFASGGKFILDWGGSADLGLAVGIQSDNKIVIAGSSGGTGSSGNIPVARLTTAGTLDATFGASGKVLADVGGTDSARTLVIQGDGKIVVAGQTLNGLFIDGAMIRLNPADGSLDATFGSGGKQVVDFGSAADSISSVKVQPDGKLVIAGNGDQDLVVGRLDAAGAGDTSFGPNGLRVINLSGNETAGRIALEKNGRIVVPAAINGGPDAAIIRVIGSVEAPHNLLVSGQANGTVAAYAPTASTGQYSTTPFFSGNPLGNFNGTLRVAVGDVNGDGIEDGITVTGPGTPIRVTVVSGTDNRTVLVQPFDPFGGNFSGGGFITAADIDSDGRAEFIVTPDQGGGPRVSIFSLATNGGVSTRANFFGIDDPSFRGGCRSALGDINGDGVPDLACAAGFLGGPRTALFNGKSLFTTPTRLVNDFFAFPGADATNLRNGAFVALGDVNGDGKADMIFGGGPGGAPRVFILSGALVTGGNIDAAYNAPVANFFVAGNSSDRGGVRLAARDADGDGKAEVVAASGEGSPAKVRIYLGKNLTGTSEPATFQDIAVLGGGVLSGGVFVG